MAVKKALSNRNLLAKIGVFEYADFEGEWLASFGRPELRGSWLIYGGSGSGKTTFTLMLSKYLSQFKRTAYNSIEQGVSGSMLAAWSRVNMAEAGSNIIFLEKEFIPDLKERLRKKKSPDVVVIDSLICLEGFKRKDYLQLLAEFPRKLFIFLSHEKNRQPDPAIGETIRRLSDVKIHVEGYVAHVTSRYENAEKGEGGAPFTIWGQGAAEYQAKFITQTN